MRNTVIITGFPLGLARAGATLAASLLPLLHLKQLLQLLHAQGVDVRGGGRGDGQVAAGHNVLQVPGSSPGVFVPVVHHAGVTLGLMLTPAWR